MLTQQQANEQWEDIARGLSPEWVYMDGEATERQARRTINKLTHAAKNLHRQGFKCPAKFAEWDDFGILSLSLIHI